MTTRFKLLTTLLLIPILGMGQIGISGNFTPSIMLRISDGSLINLPFRAGDLTLSYSVGDFDLTTNLALETRWEDAEFNEDMLQLREAYVSWYPSFGEVKAGMLIHAWGAADANNPTDNLSPYDFYYMFLAGTDRKAGNLGVTLDTYLGDWQAQIAFTPEAKANRFPFNEPDFPIQFPFEPESYVDLESPAEFGIRIQRAFGFGDISASYLKGHDQSFSLLALVGTPPVLAPMFGYRDTDVIGLDFVAFPGNWTVRGEGGYFMTEAPGYSDPIPSGYSRIEFPVDASYFQYVMQIEYQFANQVSVMAQLLGTEVLDAEGLTRATDGSMGVTLLTTDNFTPGLGTPFAMISNRVAIISSMGTFLDNSLELSGMTMVNLEETGYMISLGAEYSLWEGLNLVARSGYFMGGDEEGNRFSEMEDFSNVTLGVNVSF